MLVCLCEGGTRGAASPLGRLQALFLLVLTKDIRHRYSSLKRSRASLTKPGRRLAALNPKSGVENHVQIQKKLPDRSQLLGLVRTDGMSQQNMLKL